jgi:16S rRNA (cytidine1402-2'-O)-methyltransferase
LAEVDENKPSHPYVAYQKTREWCVLEDALAELAANADIVEQTSTHLVVGRLCEALAASSQATENVPRGTVSVTRQTKLAPGLYLVATPIGNLEDITLRALRVLEQADSIACEDTRETQKLMNHYGIRTPLVSYHAHNEQERSAPLVAELKLGKIIAVVTDAGMPGISDPGVVLAQAAIAAGVAVFPIPGANAALSALVASGLATDSFLFKGFLPSKAGERRSALETLAAADNTLIFYEAPHRILDTLSEVEAIWGPGCHVVVARELTKLHEEFVRGTVSEVRQELAGRERVRGEITLLVQARQGAKPVALQTIAARLAELQASEGIDEKEAMKRVARERGVGKSDVYRELQREKAKK